MKAKTARQTIEWLFAKALVERQNARQSGDPQKDQRNHFCLSQNFQNKSKPMHAHLHEAADTGRTEATEITSAEISDFINV